jgi:hypothetical protein
MFDEINILPEGECALEKGLATLLRILENSEVKT